jgi:DNA polymerase-3 subunit beta
MGFKKVIHAFHRVLLLLLIHIKKETKIGKMKIIAQKQLIETVLIQMQPFLEKKDITQITSHLYIETVDKTIIIKATNTEIGLIVKIENVIIKKKGKTTANGKKLFEIVRTLNDKEIILEQIEEILYIKQDKSKFKLPIFNSDNFPKFPKIEKKSKISLNSINLIKFLKTISPTIDMNNPKFKSNINNRYILHINCYNANCHLI